MSLKRNKNESPGWLRNTTALKDAFVSANDLCLHFIYFLSLQNNIKTLLGICFKFSLGLDSRGGHLCLLCQYQTLQDIMIRILAVTLRRQINSTIFKPQKSKITFGYEGVFRQFRPGGPQRSFCYCASGPIKAADDAVEYPLEVRKSNNIISVIRKYCLKRRLKVVSRFEIIRHFAWVREISAVLVFEHDQQAPLFSLQKKYNPRCKICRKQA